MVQLTEEDVGVIAKLVKAQIKIGGESQVNFIGSIKKELTSILPQINAVLVEKQVIPIDTKQKELNKITNGIT